MNAVTLLTFGLLWAWPLLFGALAGLAGLSAFLAVLAEVDVSPEPGAAALFGVVAAVLTARRPCRSTK